MNRFWSFFYCAMPILLLYTPAYYSSFSVQSTMNYISSPALYCDTQLYYYYNTLLYCTVIVCTSTNTGFLQFWNFMLLIWLVLYVMFCLFTSKSSSSGLATQQRSFFVPCQMLITGLCYCYDQEMMTQTLIFFYTSLYILYLRHYNREFIFFSIHFSEGPLI